jgi:hypothetical protein
MYEARAHMPGVLPDGGFGCRNYSDLEALINVLNSTKSFFKEFVKSGGRLHAAIADNEQGPDLEDQLSIKHFFGL